MQYERNMSSRFSSDSEANASELLENLEEMFIVLVDHWQIIVCNLSSKSPLVNENTKYIFCLQ